VTIWLYCLFGHEQVLMPYFLRYYAPQVDRLIMLDGGADEETRAVVLKYKNAEVHPSPFDGKNYDDRVFVQYAQERYKEARGHADWVLWVCADEFLHSTDPLRYSLEEYRMTGIRAIISHGYQMVADAVPTADDQLTNLVRKGAYDKIYNKTLAFDPELNVTWSVGMHSCRIEGYNPVPTGMKLLHYRYFGADYLRERNERNYARLSEADHASGHGYQSAPDYDGGRYSAAWYKQILEHGEEVI